MKLLVILFTAATLSTLALAFPQTDDDNKNASTTTTTAPPSTASNVLNATTVATKPTLAPFAPEARGDFGKPRANLKGKPLIKPLPKAKRKKLQLKPAHPQKRVQTPKRNPKPVVAKAPPKVQPVEPQRRDSPGYAAPSYAAPQREVIIQQAGPSQEYGWVGHGNGYNAPHNLQNPFPAHLTKWILQNNKIFEAGLLYPGAPGSSYSPPPPPPPAAAAPAYNAPAAPEVTYDAPSSYNVPVIPSSSSYNSPPAAAYEPAPAYVAPVEAPAATYEAAQPTYGAPEPAYDAPQPTYNAAPELPSYNVAVQAPASYDSVAVAPVPSYNVQQVPVDQYGAAVVSASYSSADGSQVDAVPATYDAATFPPPFYASVNPTNVAYKVAEPTATYEAAAPPASYEAAAPFPVYGAASAPASYEAAAPQNYGAPLIYEVAAPASYYGPSSPATTYEAAAPVQTYEAAAPVQSYEAAAPVQSYEAAAPVQTYEAAAPPPSSYGTVVQVPSAYDAPLSTYGQPAYEEPATTAAPPAAPTYSKYGAAAPPVGSFDTDAVPISYDVPAQDDQSLYNLYAPPNEQPEYQASADNSYSVPSFYDVGKPGNFPTYNSIPAAPESYGAPQEVYEVPIKVEETYQAAQQEKAPEVFYIFYENQEPAVAAQSEQTYVVAPPENNQFSPPKDIQTIYVPPENAINVPDVFGVDVGSSFGYGAPEDQSAPLRLAPSSSSFSFDSPAFNPPQRPIGDTLFRGTVEDGLKDPINKLAIADQVFQDDVQNHAQPLQTSRPLRPIRNLLKNPSQLTEDQKDYKEPALLPFGARLKKLTHNNNNGNNDS